jgi:hypothetical protein
MTLASEGDPMDKAKIFSDVTRRNALRRANWLPLLDVPAEYAHQISIASHQEYRATCEERAEERETIRQEVLAEYQSRFGREFGYSMGGRWAVGAMTRKRFAAYMVAKYAVVQPDVEAAKHPIIYGGGRK